MTSLYTFCAHCQIINMINLTYILRFCCGAFAADRYTTTRKIRIGDSGRRCQSSGFHDASGVVQRLGISLLRFMTAVQDARIGVVQHKNLLFRVSASPSNWLCN
jgi:hypothetical protein